MSMPSADGSAPDVAITGLSQTIARGLEIVAVRALGNVDEARDAVQETLARALEALRGNRVPAGVPIEAYVYGIARHVITDVLRRRVRERSAMGDPGDLPAPGPSALDVLVRTEEREAMSHALASLPAADRELLECCLVQGERVATIAARLGEPADRIRKRKSRAVERLRASLRRSPAGHTAPPVPTVAT